MSESYGLTNVHLCGCTVDANGLLDIVCGIHRDWAAGELEAAEADDSPLFPDIPMIEAS